MARIWIACSPFWRNFFSSWMRVARGTSLSFDGGAGEVPGAGGADVPGAGLGLGEGFGTGSGPVARGRGAAAASGCVGRGCTRARAVRPESHRERTRSMPGIPDREATRGSPAAGPVGVLPGPVRRPRGIAWITGRM